MSVRRNGKGAYPLSGKSEEIDKYVML